MLQYPGGHAKIRQGNHFNKSSGLLFVLKFLKIIIFVFVCVCVLCKYVAIRGQLESKFYLSGHGN